METIFGELVKHTADRLLNTCTVTTVSQLNFTFHFIFSYSLQTLCHWSTCFSLIVFAV